MHLEIYSIKKILFEGDAVSLNAKTADGEITVLDHHRPLISMLRSGIMQINPSEGEPVYIPINSGFLEVGSDNRVKCIVEEPIDDKERSEAQKEESPVDVS